MPPRGALLVTTNAAPRVARGRPPKAENTFLVAALVEKQDEMSRRAARRIDALLDTHVPVEVLAFLAARRGRAARTRLGRFVDDVTARLHLSPEGRAIIAALVDEALVELNADEGAYGPAPPVCPAPEPRPRVTRSRTLAEARAQHATLQTNLMRLRARIVRLP
jgi:hypothetical protein